MRHRVGCCVAVCLLVGMLPSWFGGEEEGGGGGWEFQAGFMVSDRGEGWVSGKPWVWVFFYQPDGESEGGDEGGVDDGVGEEDDRCVDNGAILCQL